MGWLVKHLIDHPTGRKSYRRAYPPELRSYLGRTQLRVSLGRRRGDNDPDFLDRYTAAARQWEANVALARRKHEGAFDPLDEPMIAFIVKAFEVRELKHDHERRFDPAFKPIGEAMADALHQTGHAPVPGSKWSQGSRIAAELALSILRALRGDGDLAGIVDAWQDKALQVAADSGRLIDPASTLFPQLCIGLNDMAISVYEAVLRRLDGVEASTVPALPAPPPRASELPKPPPEDRTFEAIVLGLLDSPSRVYGAGMREQIKGALRFLREALGPVRPSELTREKVTDFHDMLAQRPAKLTAAERALPLPELISRFADQPDAPRITHRTLEKHNMTLGARWTEAVRAGFIPKALDNPFSDRQFKSKTKGRPMPKGFTSEELTAYFSLPPFKDGHRERRGRGEAIFWMPLVALCTGARPEEVAQLLVADIFQREGDSRWMIRFTDEGTHPVKGPQKLKTLGRTFPVPQPLIDLGLIAYRKSLTDAGETALFPSLRMKSARKDLFPYFGEWWAEYVYSHGVIPRDSARQPFRELRHTWITARRASGISEEAGEYMAGHSAPGGSSAQRGYGEADPLGAEIDKLKLPIDIVALVPRWQPQP